jgi:hypothetical protein
MILAAIEIDLIAPVDGLFGQTLMQALQRVQTSRSIGFSWRHATSNAPEPAAHRFDAAGIDRVGAFLRQVDSGGTPGNEYRHREVRAQALGPRQCGCRGTDDQQLSARLETDARHRLRIGQHGGGDEGRDLGHRSRRLARPSSALANIDETYRLRLAGIVGDVAEQPRLLSARDKNVAARAIGKGCQLLLAKLRMNRQGPGKLQCAFEHGGIERHGAVAIAKMNIALNVVLCAHGLSALASTPLGSPESAAS